MSSADAVTAQGMATRHRRSVEAVISGLDKVNALLAKMIKGDQIKWGGYGTNFEWYIRKLKETSSWSSGQLAVRSFEEKDPMVKCTLPYCFIDQTYGVSEKSIKTNRAAGSEKIYDIQKENARNAQNALYRAFADAIYSTGSDLLAPVGLRGITGSAYEGSSVVTVTAGQTYAGRTLNTSAVTAFTEGTPPTGWDVDYFYPIALSIHECPEETTLCAKWSTGAFYALDWIEGRMTYSADVSGTGDVVRPDMAIMATDPFGSLRSALIKAQLTYNVMLGSKDPLLGAFASIRVGNIDCIRDDNVPADSGSKERVFVFDSKAFYIDTCNKKSEGLIEGEWKQDDPEITGGVGVYKSNWGLCCKTPKAVGVIVGCND
jgi:hypothetical protein